MKKKVGALDTSNEALKGKLTDSEAQIGQLIKEAKDMLMVQEELSRKMAENGKVNFGSLLPTKVFKLTDT